MHKKRRLFIAVNIPEKIKDLVEKEIEAIKNQFSAEVRFLGRENWHITITFLGYQTAESLPPIVESMERTSRKMAIPSIEFSSLAYGPLGSSPRMIWLNGDQETSLSISKFKSELEDQLSALGIHFDREHRRVQVHVTLARFPSASKKDLPVLEKKLNIRFQPTTVDLMESHLSRGGAQYEPISKIAF